MSTIETVLPLNPEALRDDFPILARFEACTLPDVDSPRKTVVLHALPRLET